MALIRNRRNVCLVPDLEKERFWICLFMAYQPSADYFKLENILDCNNVLEILITI